MKKLALLAALAVSACAPNLPQKLADAQGELEQRDFTKLEGALMCLRDYVEGDPVIAIGRFEDATGKYQVDSTGGFVTKGGYDQIAYALDLTGVEYRSMHDWGWIRQDKAMQSTFVPMNWKPATHLLSGTINRFDFEAGGGVEVNVAGYGAGIRGYGIMIGKNGLLMDVSNGTTVTKDVNKSISAVEVSADVFKIIGSDLVDVNAGYTKRGAIHIFDQASTLELVFKLVSELSNPEGAAYCAETFKGN